MSNPFPTIKPSLLLDFGNTKRLDPRVTFTRASSSGGYYDGVTTAKAEENLLTYSQEIDNAAWTKSNTTITANTMVAPDGTTTADTVTGSAGTALKYIRHVLVTAISSTTATFSFFAKEGTHRYVQVSINGDGTKWVNFDLNGSGAYVANGSGVTASVETTTNGFLRCVVTLPAASNVTAFFVSLQDSTAAAREATTSSTGNFIFWGAQLEVRSFVTAYTATTTQPITNYIPKMLFAADGVPVFDHNPTTGESLGLGIWESRTNIAQRSQEFDNAYWTKEEGSISTNSTVAPDGTVTADKFVEAATTAKHDFINASSFGVSATAHTFSIYVKAAGRSVIQIAFFTGSVTGNPRANYDLATGVLGSVDSGITASIVSIGNGWYRCIASVTFATTSNGVVVQTQTSTTAARFASYTGDGYSGVYVWGAQLEAGAFATPYIPTVASQVTRAADSASMTGTNFSTWYNQAEGTLFGEFQRPMTITSSSGDGAIAQVDDATLNNRILMVSEYAGGASKIGTFVAVGGTTQENSYPLASGQVANTLYKQAFGYEVNNFAGSVNAGTVATDVSGLVPVVTQLNIGKRLTDLYLNGYIRKLAYYPQRVSDTALQALTR